MFIKIAITNYIIDVIVEIFTDVTGETDQTSEGCSLC